MTSEIKIPKGTVLLKPEQAINIVSEIKEGSVQATGNGVSMLLGAGELVGVFDLFSRQSNMTYITLTDCVLLSYRLEIDFPAKTKLHEDPDFGRAALLTIKLQMPPCMNSYNLIRDKLHEAESFYKDTYRKYKKICKELHIAPHSLKDVEEGITDVDINSFARWQSNFYTQMNQVFETLSRDVIEENNDFIFGLIMKASEDFTLCCDCILKMNVATSEYYAMLLNDDYHDIFRFYSDLLFRVHPGTAEFSAIDDQLFDIYSHLTEMPDIDENFLEQRLTEHNEKMKTISTIVEDATPGDQAIQKTIFGSLATILAYAQMPEDFCSEFTRNVTAYNELPDQLSSDQPVHDLRALLTTQFNELYRAISLKYVTERNVPDVVKMFLYFGYVDEQLAGIDNAVMLCKLIRADITSLSENVYTFADWLCAIYDGKKEPSRNEYGIDYTDFLHEQKINSVITSNEEKEKLQDTLAKVAYELDNVFPIGNKITFGHLSTFCPLFSSANILGSLETNLLTAALLTQQRDYVRSIDYSVFYKEVVYSNRSLGIGMEYIHTEVFPDLILLPNIGSRGSMWQEMEGKKRVTPCRMLLPVFLPENLRNSFIRLCGEYRWEMCKRVQGAHWNDAASNSLTGDYFNYLQFYKKNTDLSPDAKDKIRILNTKAKNSFKEAFIMDYLVWVLYESTGSPRLNKVVRGIFFDYCPFRREIRHQLSQNPIYGNAIHKFTIKQEQKRHHLNSVRQKVTNSGKELPEEISNELSFIEE